jgi:phosphoglycolate phosphatase
MKLVLFDADGTLIDSQAIIHEAMRLTFEHHGHPSPSLLDTRSIIGLTLDFAIATILQCEVDEEVLAMTSDYKEFYLELARQPEYETLPFHGMPQLVRSLASQSGILVGLVTGKSRRGVDKLLATTDFENCFVTSRCADDCPSKPHPAMVLECCAEVGVNPADTVVVGDTSFDMEMALAAGAGALGVSWGYHSGERLHATGAHFLAHNSAQLQRRLEQIIFGERTEPAPDMFATPYPASILSHA